MSEIRYTLILFIGSHDQHFDLSNIGRLICILKKKSAAPNVVPVGGSKLGHSETHPKPLTCGIIDAARPLDGICRGPGVTSLSVAEKKIVAG